MMGFRSKQPSRLPGIIWGLQLAVAVAFPADLLHWNTALNQVSADITSSELIPVLEKISQATGWQVFLEPGTERTVSTQFKNRSPDKALDLLLGELNRAFLPSTNGSPRLLVFRTTEREATQRIQSKGQETTRKSAVPIPKELVVTVKPGTDIEELARKLGAKIVGRLDSLNTYRLRFDDADSAAEARQWLRTRDDVAAVDYNYPVGRDLPAQMYGGAYPLNLAALPVPDKDRVIVALIDTLVHPEKSGIKDFLLPGISVAGDGVHPGALPMHGDSIAQGVLRAVAALQENPGGTPVRILPVDVYGDFSMTTTFDVAKGIMDAYAFGPRIVNLSLGSEGDASYLHQVIQRGHDQGILFFAAAGNEPVMTPTYPAAYEEVIAVTARDAAGNVASYANRGAFVDIGAPGYGIFQFDNQVWRVGGTSVSTAHASGTAAGLLQGNNLDAKELEKLIRDRLGVGTAKPSK